ncbi:hypothetical protein [Paenibacillus sp. LPE1-1-1.1]
MTGRNNKPDNDGPASSPSRLEQFGDKMSRDDESIPKKSKNNKSC